MLTTDTLKKKRASVAAQIQNTERVLEQLRGAGGTLDALIAESTKADDEAAVAARDKDADLVDSTGHADERPNDH